MHISVYSYYKNLYHSLSNPISDQNIHNCHFHKSNKLTAKYQNIKTEIDKKSVWQLKSALVEQDPLECQDWVLSNINSHDINLVSDNVEYLCHQPSEIISPYYKKRVLSVKR